MALNQSFLVLTLFSLLVCRQSLKVWTRDVLHFIPLAYNIL